MPLREYAGNAPASTLNGAITAGSATITITDGTSWPTGSPGPFVVIVDRGLAAEEKVLITSRTGNVLTVNTRGFDSTTAASHANGATIEHGLSATDIREANDHVFDTTNDDHTQYLNTTRHDVEARHTFGAALGTASTPSEIGFGAGSAGSGANPSREDHIHPHNPPATRVFRSTNQSLTNNTTTAISFDTERFNTDTMWVIGAPTRITFTTAGVYVVTGSIRMAGDTDYTDLTFSIRLNGITPLVTIRDVGLGTSANNLGFAISTIYKFAAADFVELTVLQANASTAANNVLFVANESPEFAAVWGGTGV